SDNVFSLPSPYGRGLGEGLMLEAFSDPSTTFKCSIPVLSPHPRPFSQREKGDNSLLAYLFLLCQTFFLALFLRRFVPVRRGSFFGSSVAAFSTTPPSSAAISASVRFVNTE